ncbi:MAG: o-succinylbenzoate synthase [Breznakibacter sp.]
MWGATCSYVQLHFKQPAGTSRGILVQKDSWFLKLFNVDKPHEAVGVGEISIIPGLSYDDRPDFSQRLDEQVKRVNDTGKIDFGLFAGWPSIRFGFETALLDLENGGTRVIFPSAFIEGHDGIPINGLIWMGDVDFMSSQIEKKLNEGYRCLKMKIGAIGFDDELTLLKHIRKRFSKEVLELRVDANGAFNAADVWMRLDALAKLHLHSIEQPVKAGQWELMRDVCRLSPLPVALDEELIGIADKQEMRQLLSSVQPQYVILKPGLLGGFALCDDWIGIASEHGIGWWATSALEANVGLNAIAQWTYTKNVSMPQGLGTGLLYTNNVPSPLQIEAGKLYSNPARTWGI